MQSINKCIMDPIWDLLNRGGKRWRPSMGMLFAESFGRDLKDFEKNKDIYYVCALTELIHNGTLIMDDLQDQSLKRRGSECIHLKYGVDVATNTANFMYYAPLVKIDKYVPSMRLRDKLNTIYH